MRPISEYPDLESRFWSRVEKTSTCWNWIGARSGNRYGEISIGGRGGHPVHAHRVGYMLQNEVDWLPPKVLVCHKCDNQVCVRGDHLFLGSHLDNTRDMIAKGRQKFFRVKDPRNPNWQKTHCPRGHPYSGSNLYIRRNGSRACIACHRELRRRAN
jgi:hypothetical protein